MDSYFIHNTHLPKNYSEDLLQIDFGKGCYLYDKGGKEYLDFGSGIAVNSLGYGREDLAEISYNQMKKLIHVSNLYTTEPTVALADKLVQTGNFDAVHFGNSGAEANEAALKYARLYSKKKKGDQAEGFLSFTNGFHGRTMGALSVTAKDKYKTPFLPLIPGCTLLPFNEPEALEKIENPENISAVIVEVIQGEGGLEILSKEMVQALNAFCMKNDIILIADEVQTGIGRTGVFYASQDIGLNADIITLAKPLAAGLPLSATLIPKKINDLLHPGDHGSTFGGGPVTTAVALKVLETIQNPEFLASVVTKGNLLEDLVIKTLHKENLTGKVLGKGLLRGLIIDSLGPEKVGEVLALCQKQGLLVLRAGVDVIRLAPPLVINENELQTGVTKLFDAIKEII